MKEEALLELGKDELDEDEVYEYIVEYYHIGSVLDLDETEVMRMTMMNFGKNLML